MNTDFSMADSLKINFNCNFYCKGSGSAKNIVIGIFFIWIRVYFDLLETLIDGLSFSTNYLMKNYGNPKSESTGTF